MLKLFFYLISVLFKSKQKCNGFLPIVQTKNVHCTGTTTPIPWHGTSLYMDPYLVVLQHHVDFRFLLQFRSDEVVDFEGAKPPLELLVLLPHQRHRGREEHHSPTVPKSTGSLNKRLYSNR